MTIQGAPPSQKVRIVGNFSPRRVAYRSVLGQSIEDKSLVLTHTSPSRVTLGFPIPGLER